MGLLVRNIIRLDLQPGVQKSLPVGEKSMTNIKKEPRFGD